MARQTHLNLWSLKGWYDYRKDSFLCQQNPEGMTFHPFGVQKNRFKFSSITISSLRNWKNKDWRSRFKMRFESSPAPTSITKNCFYLFKSSSLKKRDRKANASKFFEAWKADMIIEKTVFCINRIPKGWHFTLRPNKQVQMLFYNHFTPSGLKKQVFNSAFLIRCICLERDGSFCCNPIVFP